MTVAVQDALAFYARHSFALFPCAAGTKRPVIKWKEGSTSDPAQWAAWQAEGNNLAIDAAKSGLIVLDVDSSKVSRDVAWAAYAALCRSWGLAEPLAPMTQSARGGWHVPVRRPAHLAATDLRGGGTLVKVSDVRPLQEGEIDGEVIGFKNRGYCVAAGSVLEEMGQQLPYLFFDHAPAPHECPPALAALLALPVMERTNAPNVGVWDINDIKALYKWMLDHGGITTDEEWFKAGMIAKVECGDAGLDVWSLICHNNYVDDKALTRWNSFASEARPSDATLGSLMKRAHALGWHGQVRKAGMFDGVSGTVAGIAAAAGASLSSGLPLPPVPGVPMIGRGEKQAEFGEPILQEFLAATTDAPSRPISDDVPELPPSLNAHGLYASLNAVIMRVIAMAEPPQKFVPTRVVDVMGILQNVHPDIFEAVCRRVRAMGRTLPDSKIKHSANAFSNKVERAFVTIDDWKRDHKGEIQHDNSDNCIVFLAQLSLEIRWNLWLERMEIKGGVDHELRWPSWTFIDDSVVAKLRTRGNRTEIRFRPADRFFWESLETIAHTNAVDPARDVLDELQAQWDGLPRLNVWLSRTCGVPCDPYHQSVSKNIIGGMVRRIRQPGCKHDFMPVFFGPQGTGKSTLAAIIADMGKSTLHQILTRSTEWFSDEVMLGDASKELVLSLAGKCLVEIGEMGQRNSASADHVKAMLSRQIDRGRTAYARAVSDRPRRNVFFGTVNGDEPLTDNSGNRRFLPVAVPNEVDLAWLCENIKQLIGEAATLESQGSDFALPRGVWAVAAEHQEAARSASDMEVLLADWFAPTEHTTALAYITAADLVQLANLCGWRNGGATNARGAIMKRLGFRQEKPIIGAKRSAVWVRGTVPHIADIPRLGVRYMVGADSQGRPTIAIRSYNAGAVPPSPAP